MSGTATNPPRPTASTPPGGTVTGAGPPPAALLAAAVRVPGADTEGERRAVAAFRTTRDTGTHRARTRRRDDWRR